MAKINAAGPVELEVVGAVGVEAQFSALARHATDMEPAMIAVGELMRDYEIELFDSEGAISGKPWEPLSEETLRTKAQKGYPMDILVATGELKASLTEHDHEDHIEEIGPDFIRFGSYNENALRHQEGTSRMPARPVIDFRELDVAAFTNVLSHFIMHGIADPYPGT